jgi:uncharacterized protein DUF6274
MPASARHETRALLRAHLSAATRYRHLTPRCPICHQLKRLAMEPSPHAATDGTGPLTDPVTGPLTVPEAPEPDCPLQGLQAADSGPDEG